MVESLPTSDDLIGLVEATTPEGDPLQHLTEAVVVSGRIAELGVGLVGHFVEQARSSGATVGGDRGVPGGEQAGRAEAIHGHQDEDVVGASFSPGSPNRHGRWWGGRRPTPEWRGVLKWVPSTWCWLLADPASVACPPRSRR